MFNFSDLRAYVPNGIKHALKPYFRTVMPNQLVALCWITFRCNYRCSYCTVVTNFDFGTVAGRETERTADEWLEAMDRMPPTLFFFAGGEPMLHQGLPDILNNLPAKHGLIGMVSNGTAKAEVYSRIKKRIGLNISFHREFIDEEKFIRKVEELKDMFNLSVNIVATKANIAVLRHLSEKFQKKEITLHVDRLVDNNETYTPEEEALLQNFLSPDRKSWRDQLDYYDYEPKLCGAGKNYINIFPDGNVYTCAGGMEYYHSPLVKSILESQPGPAFDLSQFKMGNIFDPNFKLNPKPIVCTLPCRVACDRDFTTFKRLKSPASKAA